MLVIYQLPLQLASSVSIIGSHVNLNRSTTVKNQENGDMVVTVHRALPGPSSMNGDAHLCERGGVILKVLSVLLCERNDVADVSW